MLDRRSFAKRLALGTGLLAAPRAASASAPPDGSFHFAHLTDMHVRRKRRGHDGYAACIDHVRALDPAPEFVVMGGDMAFDGLYTPKDEFLDQIDLYQAATARLPMPYYHTLGNHDLLGLSSRRKVSADDPELGKRCIMERLGMERDYYSFDHGGWHFVVLNSMEEFEGENGPAYRPALGQEQRAWLAQDLGAARGRPTVCVTHVAMFCHIGQIDAHPEMKAMHGKVIQDTQDVRLILERHNVKAVLQGHTHMTEDFTFNGIHYLTSPSVSAAWWGGNWKGFAPGYTVLTAHPDGTLGWHRETFAWTHHLEPEDTLERRRIAEKQAFYAEQERLAAMERAGG